MYMGLIKRGLCVMTAFFISAYMAGFVNVFSFIIPIVVVTSFFDGLRVRRTIMAGEVIHDDVNDFKAFFTANKFPILGLAGLLMCMEILQSATRLVYLGGWGSRGALAIAVIVLGVYFITKDRKRKMGEDKDRDLQ